MYCNSYEIRRAWPDTHLGKPLRAFSMAIHIFWSYTVLSHVTKQSYYTEVFYLNECVQIKMSGFLDSSILLLSFCTSLIWNTLLGVMEADNQSLLGRFSLWVLLNPMCAVYFCSHTCDFVLFREPLSRILSYNLKRALTIGPRCLDLPPPLCICTIRQWRLMCPYLCPVQWWVRTWWQTTCPWWRERWRSSAVGWRTMTTPLSSFLTPTGRRFTSETWGVSIIQQHWLHYCRFVLIF